MNFGIKIQKYRKLRKKTQFDLEIECGFASGMISRLENGIANPTKETLFKIALILDLKFEEIIDLICINELENKKQSFYVVRNT